MHIGFAIAEKYVPKDEFTRVCQAILMAQKLQEESWDEQCNTYNILEDNAAKESVECIKLDPFWVPVIAYWNYYDWNEAQELAELYLKRVKGENDEQ